MKRMQLKVGLVALVILALVSPIAGSIRAQGRGIRPMGRPLARGAQTPAHPLGMLERSLQQANAAALSSDQVNQLNSLIASFRSNQPKPGQDTALANARNDFDSAVLNNDANGIATATAAITAESAKLESARLAAVGQFEISALGVLTADQVTALKAQFGSAGLIRVLGTLVGPPRMFGGRGFGPGR